MAETRAISSRRSVARREWPILAILAAYLALAVTYGLVNPLFEAPDEPQHFWFIKHVADHGALPVQGEQGVETWAQEGSQPPLYYLVSAPLLVLIDTDDAAELLWFNPHVNMGVPLKEGNKNVYIHTARERFPWRGTALALHLVRLLSTLMGAGTVLATYGIMRLVFPQQRALAAAAAALNAFTPQFLFISSAANNDNLVTLLSSWTLYAILRLWARPLSWRAGLSLGLLAGLATLAKLSGLGLLALIGLALLILCRQGRPWPTLLAIGATAGAVAALVAGWWFLRNLRLYGDLTGLSAMLDVFGWREVTPGLAALLGEAEGLRISYWAIFGWFNILSYPPLYKLLDALLLVAVAGLGYGAVRRWRWADAARVVAPLPWAWALLSAGWSILLLVALVRWTRMTSGTQGRLLFPAISAISGMIVYGWSRWLPRRRAPGPDASAPVCGDDFSRFVPRSGRKSSLHGPGPAGYLAWAIALCFGLWAALCPFLHIAPAYARPPILTLDDIPAAAQPAQITYGDAFRLVATEFDRASLAPGETLHITAYWECLREVERDYSLYAHLFGLDGQALGQVDTYPGQGTYPTSLWKAGQVIQDRYAIVVAPEAPAESLPTLARVQIGPYLLGDAAERLPMRDGEGRPVLSPLVGRVRVAAKNPSSYAISHPLSVTFGQRIALLGYDLELDRAKPGEALTLTLYWRALRQPDADYTVFAHVAGEAGLAGQGDGQPAGGDYPTWAWQPGDVVRDVRQIAIRSDAAPGTYQLVVGLYQLATGQRLTAEDGSDRALLGSITVSW